MKALALLAALSACSPMVAAGNASIAVDMASTYALSDHGRWDGKYYESNPIMGERPSPLTIASYGLAAMGVNTAIARVLPRWASIPLEIVVTGFELRLAAGNAHLAMDPKANNP